jgi:hypothetical protein
MPWGCFYLLMYHRGWDGWCLGRLGLGLAREIGADGIQAACIHGGFALVVWVGVSCL